MKWIFFLLVKIFIFFSIFLYIRPGLWTASMQNIRQTFFWVRILWIWTVYHPDSNLKQIFKSRFNINFEFELAVGMFSDVAQTHQILYLDWDQSKYKFFDWNEKALQKNDNLSIFQKSLYLSMRPLDKQQFIIVKSSKIHFYKNISQKI